MMRLLPAAAFRRRHLAAVAAPAIVASLIVVGSPTPAHADTSTVTVVENCKLVIAGTPAGLSALQLPITTVDSPDPIVAHQNGALKITVGPPNSITVPGNVQNLRVTLPIPAGATVGSFTYADPPLANFDASALVQGSSLVIDYTERPDNPIDPTLESGIPQEQVVLPEVTAQSQFGQAGTSTWSAPPTYSQNGTVFGQPVQATCAIAPSSPAVLNTTTVQPALSASPIISAGGSDTTQEVMTGYLNTQGAFNIPAQPTSFFVPGDANCTFINANNGTFDGIAWDSTSAATPPKAPNGSGAGKSYLLAQRTAPAGQTSCEDIARSSSGPAGADPAAYEYYAFALDAVSWASPALSAPAKLTVQQIRDIYACTTNDWSQVGGNNGPIVPYLPQAASGTRAFFLSAYGITTIGACVVNGTLPNGTLFEENQAKLLPAADYQRAILPFSCAQWVFQANNKSNPTLDLRNEAKIGGMADAAGNPIGNCVGRTSTNTAWQLNTGTAAVPGPVNENNTAQVTATPTFPGVRYVFNVLDNVATQANYAQAKGIVGFDNVAAGARSPLCNNSNSALIRSFGFGPLSTTGNPLGTTNLAGASCRLY